MASAALWGRVTKHSCARFVAGVVSVAQQLPPLEDAAVEEERTETTSSSEHETALVAVEEVTALAAPSDRVNVSFVVPQYVTSYGQVLKVVGAVDELGNWAPEQAPTMTWSEGHQWTLDVPLPVGDVTFKVVMQDTAAGYTRWEVRHG
ncbi:hypothetical protein MNEG_4974 [Monoraphidium neglectum]|uniref:CBM20 domain-containing protein n=1 Tax=Monoraphidium neglectum TaxID=145388 RepID=A0A0D2NC14_9CHLO|nr:hypothetical protein MNEG_4974 [Monoraphidium neglectum]KIZ02986.1 hypothetical protein MNEG_4974 [Monoraphidium neglectum]|eukprot:XP_013902005.1 hypothetical protein MNEG_4974 [Monoraphidium neglectum]